MVLLAINTDIENWLNIVEPPIFLINFDINYNNYNFNILTQKVSAALQTNRDLTTTYWQQRKYAIMRFAVEIGYGYMGTEFWPSFQKAIGNIVISDVSKRQFRTWFTSHAENYSNPVVDTPWSREFNIICHPISHAICPQQFHKHIAASLMNYPFLIDHTTEDSYLWFVFSKYLDSKIMQFPSLRFLEGKKSIVMEILHHLLNTNRPPNILSQAFLDRLTADIQDSAETQNMIQRLRQRQDRLQILGVQNHQDPSYLPRRHNHLPSIQLTGVLSLDTDQFNNQRSCLSLKLPILPKDISEAFRKRNEKIRTQTNQLVRIQSLSGGLIAVRQINNTNQPLFLINPKIKNLPNQLMIWVLSLVQDDTLPIVFKGDCDQSGLRLTQILSGLFHPNTVYTIVTDDNVNNPSLNGVDYRGTILNDHKVWRVDTTHLEVQQWLEAQGAGVIEKSILRLIAKPSFFGRDLYEQGGLMADECLFAVYSGQDDNIIIDDIQNPIHSNYWDFGVPNKWELGGQQEKILRHQMVPISSDITCYSNGAAISKQAITNGLVEFKIASAVEIAALDVSVFLQNTVDGPVIQEKYLSVDQWPFSFRVPIEWGELLAHDNGVITVRLGQLSSWVFNGHPLPQFQAHSVTYYENGHNQTGITFNVDGILNHSLFWPNAVHPLTHDFCRGSTPTKRLDRNIQDLMSVCAELASWRQAWAGSPLPNPGSYERYKKIVQRLEGATVLLLCGKDWKQEEDNITITDVQRKICHDSMIIDHLSDNDLNVLNNALSELQTKYYWYLRYFAYRHIEDDELYDELEGFGTKVNHLYNVLFPDVIAEQGEPDAVDSMSQDRAVGCFQSLKIPYSLSVPSINQETTDILNAIDFNVHHSDEATLGMYLHVLHAVWEDSNYLFNANHEDIHKSLSFWLENPMPARIVRMVILAKRATHGLP